jgi:hypothetical protein
MAMNCAATNITKLKEVKIKRQKEAKQVTRGSVAKLVWHVARNSMATWENPPIEVKRVAQLRCSSQQQCLQGGHWLLRTLPVQSAQFWPTSNSPKSLHFPSLHMPETHSAEACKGTGPTERLSGRVGKGMPKSNFPQLLTSNRLADVVTQTGLA